jgi:hypothetical protein
MKKVIGRAAAVTVQELIDALISLTPVQEDGLLANTDTVYVTINSDSIRLVSIEETLTDGSKVYNIELSEVCK